MNKTTRAFLLFITLSLVPLQTLGLSFQGMEAIPTNPNAETPEYFIYETKPGDTINDKVTVHNQSDTDVSLRIYGTDTDINNQGDEVLRAYADRGENIGSWLSIDGKNETELTLAPGEIRDIAFSIAVPPETEQKKYNGGILVENISKNVNRELAENIQIKTNARLGIKTFVTVTDNPRVIKKLSELRSGTPWQQTYLYVSVALFVIVIGAFAIHGLGKKKRAHHKK